MTTARPSASRLSPRDRWLRWMTTRLEDRRQRITDRAREILECAQPHADDDYDFNRTRIDR
jgi:hypothetical protein